MSDSPSELLTLRIEKAVAGGRMLARADGAVVLVAGALPGELVTARIERRGQGTVFARTEHLLEPSPGRVGEPNPCGGCVLAHARYELQLSIKQQIAQDGFARLARHAIGAPPIVGSPTEGYRVRARLHVHGRRAGFYSEGTHTLCDPASTRQLRSDTTDAIESLMQAMGAAADELLTVDVAENRDASERAVHLDMRANADTARLGSLDLPGITSLSVSHAGSPRIRTVRGDGRITDRFVRGEREWTLSRSASAFFQGNRYLLDALVGHVLERTGSGGLTDLYAGVGLFSIAAAATGVAPVMAVEGDAVSAADLRRNSEPWRGLIQCRHDSVEAYLGDRRVLRLPTLLLDPPRTGLSRRALDGVVNLRSPRVVYVSCDVPTLARDARVLMDAGYRVAEIVLFDLFPNTAHVESVTVFEAAG